MSAPGTIDSDRGYFYTGGYLQDFVHDINLKELLEERCGVPVQIENDAKCAALADAWMGNLQVLYDPEKIAIGGGISRQSLLFERIQKNLDGIYEQMKLPVIIGRKAEVVSCRYLNDSNLIGALRHFLTC